MNLSLLKEDLRGGWKLFVLFFAVLAMYIAVIITMFDPELTSTLTLLTQSMPELMAAFGMGTVATTLAGFLANYLYGFLFLILPMVFVVMLSNRLISGHVDRGSMAWLLASPSSRGKVIVTQAFAQIISMLVMVVLSTLLTVGICQVMFPGELTIGRYIVLNLGLFCLQLAIGGICFLASCIFNESKNALAVGAGIPAAFFLVQMLVNLGGKLADLKYFTMFTLFQATGLLEGTTGAYAGAAALAALGAALYAAGIAIFRKRNLPL